MALPIAATPVLEGKEANSFLHRIKKDLRKPLGYTPTPKLNQARELIRKHVATGKK